jgi:signal transduction histidine kinase
MMFRSMRARMTWSLALSMALFISLLSAIYLLDTRRNLERSFDASLDRIELECTSLIQRGASRNQIKAQIEVHNAQVTQSGAISEGVEIWLLNAAGKPVWRYGPPRPPRGRPGHQDGRPDRRQGDGPPYDKRRREGGGRDERGPDNGGSINDRPPLRSFPPFDEPREWRSRSVKWKGETLVLGLPWHRAHHDLERQAAALAILSLLISGAAAFGAWILVGKTLRPIDDLTEQARQAGSVPTQLLERRAPLQPTSSDQEMQNLVSTLNQMLDNVHEAALSKERFHTSASHELRTPLQALAGHLSITLSRDRDATQYKEAVQEAALHTARLSKLTRDLLLLNRVQTGGSGLHTESVDVTEMGDIALQRAEKTIDARALHMVSQWEPLEIEAAPSHVEILLGNLVENAAKYCRAGGIIGLEIEAKNRMVRVWNECDEEQYRALQSDIPRLFEPFYRPDSARSSDTGGNGLGLAICHSIAEANGWNLSIETVNGQFQVCVHFASQEKS